ncbi:MAG TPA: magnesium/cobalt transporter CorA [Thermomicrobiales bacterium]|nr:magnesium/cobalt transporter CorA [Thermomicrobiales bacterium]
MITVCIDRNGKNVRETVTPAQISELVADPAALLWVDLADPTTDEMDIVAREFAFHPLAVEDATRRHQRPKLDEYDGYLFMIFYTLDLCDGHPCAQEIAFFIGKNYVMTIHDGHLPALADTRERWLANVANKENRTVGFLVYTILDAIVDDYFPVIDAVAERIDALEDEIFAGGEAETQEEIFRLKRDLLDVRRIVAPERDVLNRLVRRDTPLFDPSVIVYFQDVYDHIMRVTDAVDTYRDVLSSALDANLSMTSFRLNQVVKRLTSWSIILMSVTLIASIYGMNFVYMPELSWQWGYPAALGGMTLLAVALLLILRKIDWL